MDNNNNLDVNLDATKSQSGRGRPRNITDAQLRYCVGLYKNGRTLEQVTNSLNSKYKKNFSVPTLGYHLRRLGVTRPRGRRAVAE